MKTTRLTALAGLSGALLSATAAGEFTGAGIEYVDFGPAFDVVLYFDDPNDQVYSVRPNPCKPFVARTRTPPGLYQHEFGGDTAPNEALIIVFPSLAHDTFLTIGKTNSTNDLTTISLDFPGFGAMALCGNDFSWSVPRGSPQSFPDNDGRVVVGRFSGDPPGASEQLFHGICGSLLATTVEDGVVVERVVNYEELDTGCSSLASLDFDYDVDAADLLILLGAWGGCDQCIEDLNCNGAVDVADLLILLADWHPDWPN